MAWKQDLAKLKQQLAPEVLPPAPKQAPKPLEKPTGPVPMEDEDAFFLAAMGLKPSAPKKAPRPSGMDVPVATGTPPPPPETFEEALRDLKGLRPLPKDLPRVAQPTAPPRPPGVPPLPQPLPPPTASPKAPAPVSIPCPELALPSDHPDLPSWPVLAPAVPFLRPTLFQLAAGMALEVDATLDLRGHSLSDAMERLKDRLGDGHLLGWRILQVSLGSDPVLHEGLLTLLASGEVPMVLRYAKAPIPMGGSEAWLLYLGSVPAIS